MLKIKENKENPLETIITRSGISVDFTTQQLLDHLKYTEKTLKETVAQMEAEDAQNKMIEQMIPLMKDFPEDINWQLVGAYAGRKLQRPESISLKEKCEEVIKDYNQRLQEIKDLGIEWEIKSPLNDEIKQKLNDKKEE